MLEFIKFVAKKHKNVRRASHFIASPQPLNKLKTKQNNMIVQQQHGHKLKGIYLHEMITWFV